MEEKEWNYCIQMIFSLIMAVSVSAQQPSCFPGYTSVKLTDRRVSMTDCSRGYSPSPTTGNPDYRLLNKKNSLSLGFLKRVRVKIVAFHYRS
jgi:hypothetical protein